MKTDKQKTHEVFNALQHSLTGANSTHCPQISEMRKCLLALSLAMLRQNAESVLKLMSCLLMQTYITLLLHFVKICYK